MRILYNSISFLVLTVFDNEPYTVAVAKAAGLESGITIPVNVIDVVFAVVAFDDNSISVIYAI